MPGRALGSAGAGSVDSAAGWSSLALAELAASVGALGLLVRVAQADKQTKAMKKAQSPFENDGIDTSLR